MRIFTLLTLALLSFNCVFGQKVLTTFKLINAQNEPVPLATFVIKNRIDTNEVYKKAADNQGFVRVELQLNSQYTLTISAVSYKTLKKEVLINSKQRFFTFVTSQSVNQLREVVVSPPNTMLRQENDKTIVDVESLIASSTNTFEIMEKTPGLFIDQDGKVYLNSTTPATILINGRDFRMSAADMSSMLKSLPPNVILKIELLRTPSAKYDASNSGGIVNIVLRKGVKVGLTGSVSSGFNQGKFGNQFVGFTLNNNNGKVNTYLNAQYTRQDNYTDVRNQRLFAPDSVLKQSSRLRTPGNLFYTGFGVSFDAGKKWEFGYDGTFSLNHSHNSYNDISDIMTQGNAAIVSENDNVTLDRLKNYGLTNSISTKYKLDTLGSEWTTDFFYNYSNNKTDETYDFTYSIPDAFNSGGVGNLAGKTNLYVAQTDLIKKYSGLWVMEAGIKTSSLSYNAGNNYFITDNSGFLIDSNRTVAYHYRENITAAYLQFSKTISKFMIKYGLRYEYTQMEGTQTVPLDQSFTIKRGDFFPYVYISRDLFPVGGYMVKSYLIYRRSITRPDYGDLNPSPKYIDPYTFEVGNPSLRPQFVNNAEANISVQGMPLLAVGYNQTSDVFSSVIYQADSSRSVSYRTYENIGSNKEFYLRALMVIPPKGRYFFLVGAQYNHSFYQGLYDSQPISFKRGSWLVFSNQRYKIDNNSVISMNGFFRFNGLQQFYELGMLGSLNFNINRQFLNKKLTVTLSYTDVLFSNNYNYSLNQGPINETGYRESDTRRFGLNLRYSFGLKKKEEPTNIFKYDIPDK